MDTETIITLSLTGIGVLVVAIQGIFNYRLKKKIAKLQEDQYTKENREKEKSDKSARTAAEEDRQALLSYWIKKMECIDFAGFKAMNAKPVPLEKIYIRLRATPGGLAINEHSFAKIEESEWEHSRRPIREKNTLKLKNSSGK